MTDKEVYLRFTGWMNLSNKIEMLLNNGNTLINFSESDKSKSEVNFTTLGYDDFYSGAEFTPEGKLVKGYLDSHVAWRSTNCEIIEDIVRKK